MGKIKVSNGTEQYEIDPSDLQNAIKDGFKEVKRIPVTNGKEVLYIDDTDLENAMKDGYKPKQQDPQPTLKDLQAATKKVGASTQVVGTEEKPLQSQQKYGGIKTEMPKSVNNMEGYIITPNKQEAVRKTFNLAEDKDKVQKYEQALATKANISKENERKLKSEGIPEGLNQKEYMYLSGADRKNIKLLPEFELKKQEAQVQEKQFGDIVLPKIDALTNLRVGKYTTENGEIDYEKAYSDANEIANAIGGSDYTKEVVAQRIIAKEQVNKIKPQVDKNANAEFKKLTGQTIDEFTKSKSPQEFDKKVLGEKAYLENQFIQEQKKSTEQLEVKASQEFEKFKPLLEQAQTEQEYNDILNQYSSSIKRLSANENAKLKRVYNEMNQEYSNRIKKLQSESGLSEQEIKKINDVYTKAYQKTIEDNYKTNLAIQTAEGLQPLGQPKVLGKSLAQGFNQWLSSIGSSLVSAGFNNSFTDALRGRQQAVDRYSTIDAPLEGMQLLNPTTYTTRLGKQLGMQVPSLALTAITKNPLLGGTAAFVAETSQIAGDTYNQILSETGNPIEAENASENVVMDNLKYMPLYFAEADLFIKAGKGNLLKNMAAQMPIEVTQELTQGYSQQAQSENRKDVSKFIKEDAPDIIKETALLTVLQQGAFGGIGRVYEALGNKNKGVGLSYLIDIADKKGLAAVGTILEARNLNNLMTDEDLVQTKDFISKVQADIEALRNDEVDNNSIKAYAASVSEAAELQKQADELAINSPIRQKIETKISELKRNAEELSNGRGTALIVTIPNGTEVAVPEANIKDTIEALKEDIKNGKVEVKIVGDAKDIKLPKLSEPIEGLDESGVPITEKVEEKPLSNVSEPTQEQQLKDIQNGDTVTFTYKSDAEIPEIFKYKISSRGETNGEPIIRVTVAKSLADFHLQNQSKTETIKESVISPKESKQLLSEQITPTVDKPLQEGITATKEQGTKEPIQENINDVGKGTAEVTPTILNKDSVKEYTTKSGRQKVVFKDGELEVLDIKTNAKVSDKTKRKAVKEYAENFDFSVGKKSGEIPQEVRTEEEAKTEMVKQSENPFELAEIYVNEEPTTQPLSTTERMIADYGLGKVKLSGYQRFGDRNKMTMGKAKSYISKEGGDIDSIAKEMSDYYEVEITPLDIVEFMDRFPNGVAEALKKVESNVAIEAAYKFQQLTGLKLNKEIAEKAINQQFEKLNQEQQKLIQQDYETAKQLEDAYWAEYAKTDGFTKESVDNKIEPTKATQEVANAKEAKEPTIKADEGIGKGDESVTPKENVIAKEDVGKDLPKAKEIRIEIFNKKADDVANNLKDLLIPKHMRDIKKSGVDLEKVIDTAIAIVKKANEAKENIQESIEEAIKYIKTNFGDNWNDNLEQPLRDKFNSIKKDISDLETEYYTAIKGKRGLAKENAISKFKENLSEAQLKELDSIIKTDNELNESKIDFSFLGLQEVANEFGLTDITSRERKSDVDLFSEAKDMVTDWVKKGTYEKNISKIVIKGEEKGAISDIENVILGQHISTLRTELNNLSDINSAEYGKKLNELDRLLKAANTIRSTQGAALRVPILGIKPRYDLPDMLIRKKEALNVSELTEEQTLEIQKEYEDIKKRAEIAEAKNIELEKKIAEYKANQAIKAEKKQSNTPKTKDDFVKERQSLKEKLKKQLQEYKENLLNVGIIADGEKDFIMTTKIAKTISDIVKSHVEEVGQNLAEVTKKVIDEVKDVLVGITEKDIHEVMAGKYNEKKPTKTKLELDLAALKKEVKLIDELDKLQSGQIPNNKKQRLKTSQKIKDIQDQIKDFKKSEGLDDRQKLINLKKRNEDKIQKINEKIANKDFEETPKSESILDNYSISKKFPKEFNEAMDSQIAKEEAEHKYEVELLKDLKSRQNLKDKTIDFVKVSINTITAIKSGIDDSFMFIQGLPILASNWYQGMEAISSQWKDFFSEKRFRREIEAVHNNKPLWDLIQKSGLDYLDPKSLREGNRDEILGKRNWLNSTYKVGNTTFKLDKYTTAPFERLYTSLGNNLRLNVFVEKVNELQKEGKTFESHPQLYKDLGRIINEMSGRGKLHKKLEPATDFISMAIWSPKLLSSTLNILGLGDALNSVNKKGEKGYYTNLSPEMRKFAIANTVKAFGTLFGVMFLWALNDDKEVDLDPSSVTFGQVKDKVSGNSYNILGRFTSVARILAMLSMGKKTIDGQEIELDKSRFGASRGNEIWRFTRGKFNPVAGEVSDFITQKTFDNKQYTVDNAAERLLVPMSVIEISKGLEQQGYASILKRGIPSFVGVKVSNTQDFMEQDLKEKEWKFLADNGLRISNIEKSTLKIKKNGKEEEVNTEQYNAFMKEREDKIKSKISTLLKKGLIFIKDGKRKDYKNINSIPSDIKKEVIKKAVLQIQRKATEQAKLEVLQGGVKEKKDKVEIILNDQK